MNSKRDDPAKRAKSVRNAASTAIGKINVVIADGKEDLVTTEEFRTLLGARTTLTQILRRL